MKKIFITGVLCMAMSTAATAEMVYEIVSFKFKEGISFSEQKLAMEKLNTIVKKQKGFKNRTYYYSQESGTWVDLVKWDSLSLAKQASEAVMKDGQFGEVAAKIDEKSMNFSHYNQVGQSN